MWGGRPGRIWVAKKCINYIEDNKQSIHFALYFAGSMGGAFKEVKIKRIFSQKTMKLIQVKSAARTIFARRRD